MTDIEGHTTAPPPAASAAPSGPAAAAGPSAGASASASSSRTAHRHLSSSGTAALAEHVLLPAGSTLTRDASETPAPGTWTTSEGNRFKVRCGPNYAKTGRKEPSGPSFYTPLTVDVVRTELRLSPCTPLINLPQLSPHLADFKHPHITPMLVICASIPDGASLFGSKDDGPSINIIIVLELTREAAAIFSNPAKATPASRLFENWARVAQEDQKFRWRFKIMAVLQNFSELGLPSMLSGYNGKPAIISRSGSLFRDPEGKFLEMDINVHVFSYLARKTTNSLRHRIGEMIMDIGAVIEGRSDDEQPENMLMCLRMNCVDLFNALQIPPTAVAWLKKHTPLSDPIPQSAAS